MNPHDNIAIWISPPVFLQKQKEQLDNQISCLRKQLNEKYKLELDIRLIDIEVNVLIQKYEQVAADEKMILNRKILNLQNSIKIKEEVLHSHLNK